MLNNLPPSTNLPPGYVVDTESGYAYKKETITNRGFTVEKKKQFMTLMEKGLNDRTFNEGKICREVGISKHLLTAHLKFDQKLRREYSDILEQLIDLVEDMAFHEAITNPRAASERKFILERRRAAIYGKKEEVEIKKPKDSELLEGLLKSLDNEALPPTS